jgi:superfamily II DNA or RNA helicase
MEELYMSPHKIIVRHSCIIVNDYKYGDAPGLESQFEVFDPGTHERNFFGIYYDIETETLYLPRGIDVWYVEKQIGAKAYIDRNCMKYSHTNKDLMISKLPRDDDQKEALRFLLGKGEYKVTKEHSQLCLNLSTGKGKSYCSIAACAYESVKFAIITYSTDCLLQWKDYLNEYAPNVPDKSICLIQGSGVINRLMIYGADKYDVFLISYGTIKSYANQYGWNKVTELFEKLKIGTKIIDEAHQNFGAMTMVDFYTNIRKTLYVTATKGRSSEGENRIYQLYFKNVLAIDLFNPEKDPHTNYKAMMFNSKPSAEQIHKCKNAYGLNRIEYVNYISDNEYFYSCLSVILDMALSHRAKTLIYIGTNNAIIKVYEWIREHFPELRNKVGIYTTLTPKEKKQKELDNLIILSTTKSCGAAMDIKGLKITVVAAEPFKSDIIAVQTLGRTRANNTLYIEFVDTGLYYTKYYYTCKKPTFDKYALTTSEIRYQNDDLMVKYEDIMDRRNPQPRHQPTYAIRTFNEENLRYAIKLIS